MTQEQLEKRSIEGLELNLPCRVVTKLSPDGRFLNIEQVLPQATPQHERRGR